MQSPPTSDNAVEFFDSSRPFRGLVLCCTSIEADQRTEIAQRAADMGGVHKYDLTPDVTHLIVGDYDTAKYRHVAKERPDIKPMAAGWVEAVRELWVAAQEMDFVALENSWKLQTFEAGGGIPNSPNPPERERQRLVCCLTGFEDGNVRAMIEDKVKTNGGEYVADLSKRVTHLIVNKPEGKKYNAARKWEISCVSIEWLHDSVERGMILLEECYDPTLPPEERGKGAWSRRDLRRISLGKRAREEPIPEGGKRKLRKSASMKMGQSDKLWGDILSKSAGDLSRPDDVQRESSAPAAPVLADSSASLAETLQPIDQRIPEPPKDREWPALRKGVFSGCRFFVHGFPAAKEQILFGFLTSHGGQLSSSLEDVASLHHTEPPNQRYLLVPQTSQPDSHPQLPDSVHIITEFFIERCIHNKTLFSPTDHIWGQPFPRFPLDGFQKLTICTAGFVNEQLNQIEKTVTQLGATYSEKLNKQVSLLVCPDLASLREQKRDLAIYHNILIVNVEWLWQCITAGCLVPWDRFQFEELTRIANHVRARLQEKEEGKNNGLNRSRSEPVLAKPPIAKPSGRAPAPPPRAGVDMTAFESDIPGANHGTPSPQEPESHYETAPTQPYVFGDAFATAPLSETTASKLNKAASPPKQSQQEKTPKRFPVEGEVGDSEGGEESDATTHTVREAPSISHSDTDSRLKRLELSKRLNSLMADDTAQEGGAPLQRPGRRKRQILGRAPSNVSVTSSASADSGPGIGRRLASAHTTTTTASEGSEFDRFLQDQQQFNTENPPLATQLEYEDLNARRKREAVEQRMRGHGKLDGSENGMAHSPEKLRLADFGSSVGASATRRMTRRQGR
ncbi:hypothetical protein GGR51DRAFT_549777 [Nemania sp. FL0031]|nr:hypothetical protein GGR51DRAFT_549777 [Nemania sp. FL0031]